MVLESVGGDEDIYQETNVNNLHSQQDINNPFKSKSPYASELES